jgi:ATP-dependent DNA helicase PIF1
MTYHGSFARVYPILDTHEETGDNATLPTCTYASNLFMRGVSNNSDISLDADSIHTPTHRGFNVAGFIVDRTKSNQRNTQPCTAQKLCSTLSEKFVDVAKNSTNTSTMKHAPFGVSESTPMQTLSPQRARHCQWKVNNILHLIPTLSPEQQAVIIAVMKGKNVFFSGAGGTGKSHLLRVFFALLPEKTAFFTATSGLSAVNIDGTTIHSFAGIGHGDESAMVLALRIKDNPCALKRWRECTVLVCDDIPLLGGELFDKLEHVARIIRNSAECFGGIQLVLSGDFLQLAPVKDPRQTFEALTWSQCIQVSIILTTAFRQLHDDEFINMLSHMRRGTLSDTDLRVMKRAAENNISTLTEHGVIPTRIHGKRSGVQADNESMLKSLRGRSVYFDALDCGKSDKHLEELKRNCPAKARIELRVGAQVVLLKNMHRSIGLCKGSRGIVTEFVRDTDTSIDEITLLMSGNTIGSSLSGRMHTASITSACDKSSAPTNFTPLFMKNEPELKELGGYTVVNLKDKLLPRVLFDNGTSMTVEYDVFSTRVQGEVVASRTQLPLELAWALSAHAVQGMTLKSAIVNAEDMFACGQMYVACSRVSSLCHLRIENFGSFCLKTNLRIVRWYDALSESTKTTIEELLLEKDMYFSLSS